jgi:AIPR protein
LKEEVRQELQVRYGDLWKKIHHNAFQPEWLFLTTATSNAFAETALARARRERHRASILIIDRPDVLRAFALYQEGAAPPDDPLDFRFEGSPFAYHNGEPHTAVYAARLDDILHYVRKDPALRLFSRNVRLALRSSPINAEIKRTFRQEPQDFMLGHNGITIICSRSQITGGHVRLEQPNVVNGAQTLLSLRDEPSSHGRALALTRVIDIGDYTANARLVRAIAVRSNTQNAISAPDLVACDERQVQLERYFRRNGRIYIRRRGQEVLEMGPRSGTKIRSIALAQILACCDRRIGIWSAGHSKNALFEPHTYQDLFEKPSLDEIYAKYSVFEVLDAARKTAPQSRRRKLRYVWRNALSATWVIIDSDAELRWEVIRNKILTRHRAATAAEPKLMRELRGIYDFAWKMYLNAKKRDRDLEPDKFFFGEAVRADQIAQRLAKKFDHRLRKVFFKYVKTVNAGAR